MEAKEAEKAQAEQAAYDAGMAKTIASLTAQFRDVGRAFSQEVWDEAMNAARVDPESELRAPDRVYYPPALRLAPAPPQPTMAPSFALPSTTE